MSDAAPTMPTDAARPRVPDAPIGRLTRWLTVLGDRLNPILVKETRQALKSRQFGITFVLLLLFGWAWSIGGSALIGPRLWYIGGGAELFYGYYVILGLPLVVIVPFGAYRSLAGEREDNTFELLSITSLRARQIIAGKLGSAAVQMAVYLSAISPCLSFTYLLGGIELPAIAYALFWLVAVSLGLSLLGLLAATTAGQRHWQVVMSVGLIIGLLYAGGLMCAFGALVVSGELAVSIQREFWMVNGALLTAYLGYFALFYYAAAAQLAFAGENASTRPRVVAAVQHALLTAWMACFWLTENGDEEVLLAYVAMACLQWFAVGVFLTGESPDLSPRVKRDLPRSFLGRVFLTWFNPGPGTGYMLATGGVATVLLSVVIAGWTADAQLLGEMPGWNPRHAEWLRACAIVAAAYVVIYLGVGRLVLRLAARFTRVGPLLTFLVHTLLVLAGIAVPMVIQASLIDYRNLGYTLLQISNPLWTFMEFAGDRSLPAGAPVILVVLPIAALLVVVVNLHGVVEEMRAVRTARPRRVEQEERAHRPPPTPQQISPWTTTIDTETGR